jgi:hypothetical protein
MGEVATSRARFAARAGRSGFPAKDRPASWARAIGERDERGLHSGPGDPEGSRRRVRRSPVPDPGPCGVVASRERRSQALARVAPGVLGVFLRAIRSTLRHASPEAPAGARIGAVSFLHRFGWSLDAQFFELRPKVSRITVSLRYAPHLLSRSAPLPPVGPRRGVLRGWPRGGPVPRGLPSTVR